MVTVTCQGCGRSVSVGELPADVAIEHRSTRVTSAAREVPAEPEFEQLFGVHSRLIKAIRAKIGVAGFEDQLLEWTIDAKLVAKHLFVVGKKSFDWAQRNNAQVLIGGKPSSFDDFGQSITDDLNTLVRIQRSLQAQYGSRRSKLLQDVGPLVQKIKGGIGSPILASQVKSWISDARNLFDSLLICELQMLRATGASGDAVRNKSGQTVTAVARINANYDYQRLLDKYEGQLNQHSTPLLPERSRARNPTNRGTRRVSSKSTALRSKRPPDGTAFWSARRYLNSAANVLEHARWHMAEFSFTDVEAYRRAARDFVCNPPLTAETFIRDNGEVMIYDPTTNTFGVRTADGAPSTMFKPRDGLRYWIKQLKRYGGERENKL